MNNSEVPLKLLLGLEIHITINSQKKIFNWENTYQGDIPPNSQVGAWELGYLGVLPIINPEVIELGLKLATALTMETTKVILFDRKIYNYFDLPKGYQITQQKYSLATNGYLPIIKEDNIEKIPIKSLHLEEDTAKSIYSAEGIKLDFNRAGNPLVELVTAPVFSSIKNVLLFIKQLQSLLRYLDISEAKMEKGQLRVDLNYSLKLGNNYSTPRYEIKNLNSLANIEKSLQCEINKHRQLFSQEQLPPSSQTFGFDEAKQRTVAHREKTDYFYLPEFNIPPIKIKTSEITKIKKNLPTLPWLYWQEIKEIDLKNANILINQPLLLKTFNFLVSKKKITRKESLKWITFYLNYLSPRFENHPLTLFTKKWKSYCHLFQSWQAKELSNKEVESIIYLLLETNRSFVSLVKRYRRKTTHISENLLEEELKKLWTVELAKKLTINRQKVHNYLLGQIKQKYPNCSVPKIIATIEQFLAQK